MLTANTVAIGVVLFVMLFGLSALLFRTPRRQEDGSSQN